MSEARLLPSAAIQVESLGYRYPDGTLALDDGSFSVVEGESVYLAGPNGAGKSTLLLALAGLLDTAGEVRIAGQLHQDAVPLGLVFQDPDDQLFCATVAEDVAFGPRNQKLPADEVSQRVMQALEQTGLAGFEHRSAHHLSGGEKKRAAIAAVLACRPLVLALDEPWANLDARGAAAVTRIINSFAGTRIITSQDLHRAAEVCQRIIVLDQGRVVADGPLDQIVANRDFLEEHGLEAGRICPHCKRCF